MRNLLIILVVAFVAGVFFVTLRDMAEYGLPSGAEKIGDIVQLTDKVEICLAVLEYYHKQVSVEVELPVDSDERFNAHITSYTLFQVMKIVYDVTLAEDEKDKFCDRARGLPKGVNAGGAYPRADLALEVGSKRAQFEHFLELSYFSDNIMDADILDIYVFMGFITYEMLNELGEISPIK